MANGGNPNANPKCGSQINIHSPASGETIQATVVDTCVGCTMYDVDVTNSLFTKLAGGLTAGRVSVDWGAYIPISSSFPPCVVFGGSSLRGKRLTIGDRVPGARAQGQGAAEESYGLLGQLDMLARTRRDRLFRWLGLRSSVFERMVVDQLNEQYISCHVDSKKEKMDV